MKLFEYLYLNITIVIMGLFVGGLIYYTLKILFEGIGEVLAPLIK